MKKLYCPECKKRVHKLSFTKEFPQGVCEDCKKAPVCNKTYLGIDVFPADGIFLEHVEPQGRRFFSRAEMRSYEKKTGTLISMLH